MTMDLEIKDLLEDIRHAHQRIEIEDNHTNE